MWYKIDRFCIGFGFGFADDASDYVSAAEFGIILIILGVAAWVFVKVPFVLVLTGVLIVLANR